MKTLLRSLSALFLLLSIYSCEGTLDNATVTVKESGTLEYTLLDTDSIPLSDITLFLFDLEMANTLGQFTTSSPMDYAIKSAVSDKNGKLDFGEVNKGLYLIFGEAIDKDNNSYDITSCAQIVSGIDTKKEISLADYSGTVDLKIYEVSSSMYSQEVAPIESINIALIPYQSSSTTGLPFNVLMSMGIQLGTTDSIGSIRGDNIPVGIYYVLAYHDEDRYDFLSESYSYSSNSIIEINRHQPLREVLYAQKENLSTPLDFQTEFHVYYTMYNDTTYQIDTINLVNASVLLTTTSSSYYSSALSSQDGIFTTDKDGIAKIPYSKELRYSGYYIWVSSADGTAYRVGDFSTSSLLNQTIPLMVPSSTFYKVYGAAEIEAKIKYMNDDFGTDTIALEGTYISLTQSSSTYYPGSEISVKSDSSGIATFNNVPVGTYFIWAYTDASHNERSNQVLIVEKNKTVKTKAVFNASKVVVLRGDLNFEILGQKDGVELPVKDAHIILTTSSQYNVPDAITQAEMSGKTDENGEVSFTNLEVGKRYYAMIYYDLDTYYRASSYYVEYNTDNIISINTSTALIN